MIEALEGFDKRADGRSPPRRRRACRRERPVVVGRLQVRRQMTSRSHLARGRLRSGQGYLLSAQRAPRTTIPSDRRGAYASRGDLSPGPRRLHAPRERRAGAARCEYLRIDAPQYAALLDETIREGYRQRGSDPDHLLDTCIELDNAIIAGHPGVTFGIHICRGNHKSMFYAAGGYDRIASQIFSRSRFQRFLLEYDDERSGPSNAAPRPRRSRGRASGSSARSGPLRVRRRARAASPGVALLPLDRLAISPQCASLRRTRATPGRGRQRESSSSSGQVARPGLERAAAATG